MRLRFHPKVKERRAIRFLSEFFRRSTAPKKVCAPVARR